MNKTFCIVFVILFQKYFVFLFKILLKSILHGTGHIIASRVPVIDIDRLSIISYVDSAYCRCRPSTDHCLHRIGNILHVFLTIFIAHAKTLLSVFHVFPLPIRNLLIAAVSSDTNLFECIKFISGDIWRCNFFEFGNGNTTAVCNVTDFLYRSDSLTAEIMSYIYAMLSERAT